jgi:hypothetical protein
MMQMNSQPKWVWKQRAAVGRFLISFYVRRSLNIVRGSLPSLPRCFKPETKVKPLPRRHPRAVKIEQSGGSARADY